MPPSSGPAPQAASTAPATTPPPFEQAQFAAARFNPAEFANIARHEESFWWYRGMRRIQLDVLEPVWKRRTITSALEAGCGAGYLARLLQHGRGIPLMAMDYSDLGLRYGISQGLKNGSQGSLLDLPFANQCFDLAMSFDVLQQFERGLERRALSELARVLRAGGLLALRVSAFEALRSRHSEYVRELQRYTRPQLCRLVEDAGFRVLRATYANALLSPVALFKFRVVEPLFRGEPESGIQPAPRWLDALLYAALRAEAAWLRAGLSLPFGQSLLLVAEKS